MFEVVDKGDIMYDLIENSIFKEMLKKSDMDIKDLNVSKKDLEINLTKFNIDIEDIDEELIQIIVFEYRLKRFLKENNLYPSDKIKEKIIEDNFENFKEFNKFQDLVDNSQIYSREEFIFNHITNWKQYGEYETINSDMDYACKTLANNLDFLNTLIETNYYGKQDGGWCYIINRDILNIIY